MRILVRAYQREIVASVGVAALAVIGLIVSGLWWVLLIIVGLMVGLALVGLYTVLSFVTNPGDLYSFGAKVWRRYHIDALVKVYLVAVYRNEPIIREDEQIILETLSPKQRLRYDKRYRRLRKAAGHPPRTFTS